MDRFCSPAAYCSRSILVLAFVVLIAWARTAAASVIIDEIMQNPAAVSDAHGEWFELFNPGMAAVDLYHWRIADRGTDSHLIADHVTVSAGGFAVLARSAGGNGGVVPDYVYGSDIALGNGADQLLLYDPSGTQIDRVEWDGGPLFPDPNGASMALLAPALDNDLGSSWVTGTTPFGAGDLGTPGAANFAAFKPGIHPPPAMPAPSPLSLLLLPAGWLLLCAGTAPRGKAGPAHRWRLPARRLGRRRAFLGR